MEGFLATRIFRNLEDGERNAPATVALWSGLRMHSLMFYHCLHAGMPEEAASWMIANASQIRIGISRHRAMSTFPGLGRDAVISWSRRDWWFMHYPSQGRHALHGSSRRYYRVSCNQEQQLWKVSGQSNGY